MRILFPDLSRPKATAKALARLSPSLKLSRVQDALARALGYRDWHELSVCTKLEKQASDVPHTAEIVSVVLGLAEALDLDPADVQYTIARTRLLSGRPISLEAHLHACAAISRRGFGSPGRGKPGTVVKVNAHGAVRTAYLQMAGRPTYLLFDSGPGECADFEVVTPRTPVPDFVPARLWLPYGYWTLKDGSEVIFSRDYFPLWRVADDVVERLDPWLSINGITDQCHFTMAAAPAAWHTGPARQSALQHLTGRRIRALPRLVSALPYLFSPDVREPSKGVERLHAARGSTAALPEYAQLNKRLALGRRRVVMADEETL